MPDAETALKLGSSCVVNFCATWCEPCEQMNKVFSELAAEHTSLRFIQVSVPIARRARRAARARAFPSQLDADTFPDLCERYSLESVPAFLFLNSGKLVDSVMGADVTLLVSKVCHPRAAMPPTSHPP